jgi:hypothetical protein
MEEQNQELSSYEQEMIAKAEGADGDALLKDSGEFSEEKQSLLAGKYKTAEDLERAYKALESKLGAPKEEVADIPVPTNEAEAKEVVEAKGVDFEALNYEFAEQGELSKATYDKLAKAGIPETAVNAYIAGQQALVEQNITKLQSLAGGEKSYQEMINWASESLSPIEKEGFNQALSTEAGSQFAIQGLYARYRAEAGAPNLIRGNSSTPNSSGGYESSRQMMVDMASPQYKVDPAFRQMVQNKVARSKF